MRTCGNIDGKPCEFFDAPECERAKYRSGNFVTISGESGDACVPMLALVEARARVDELEAKLSRVVDQNGLTRTPKAHSK